MNSRSTRLLAGVIGGWLLLAIATVHARTLKYPDLKGLAPLLSFGAIPAADGAKDFTETARAIMQQDKLDRKAKLIAAGEDTVGDGLKARFVRFANKVDGDPLTVTLYCLPTHGDRAVLIFTIAFPDEPASSREIIRKLLASIRLIRN